MRLLERNSADEFVLTKDFYDDVPQYAILSHTWEDGEEVTFKDLMDGTGKDKNGYDKIRFCEEQAKRDSLRYFWVDTCCIDKANSVEVQEAINSMFGWYQNAAKCYVYIPDVSMNKRKANDPSFEFTWESNFRGSRWFTRGWTLQELLAPGLVEFFSREGKRLGDKRSLERQIHEVTGISLLALRGTPLHNFGVAERLSWAENRQTTRKEDEAYSLFGIFDIQMPLLYGEGREKALKRLREEIDKSLKGLNIDDTTLQWLSPTDFPAQQHDIISRREEGTGQWFLEAPEFKGWLLGYNKTLFCPGIPGSGKSMMAAIAINHIYQTILIDNVGIAYLFCSYKAQTDQSASSLFAALLKQLVHNRPDITGPVTRMYEYHSKRMSRPSFDEIFGALQSISSNYATIYIIVDALDECADRDGARGRLIDKLVELQGRVDMRLLFTSRSIPEITQKFELVPILNVRASEGDVRRFVAGQIPRLPNCIQRDKKLKNAVQNEIVEAVDGMFLLARLHIDSLFDKMTKHKVLSALKNLSKGSGVLDEVLNEAYSEATKRIDGQLPGRRLLARRAICWISYAQRPLTTTELCHALAIEPDDKALNKYNVYDVEDVISVCAGLVTVDEESKIIRLVHYTTQEYFERVRSEWNSGAQEEIAVACITYLSFDTFRSGSCADDEAFEQRLAKNAFFEYSASYWSEHIRPVETAISHLAPALFCNEALVDCIIQAVSITKLKNVGYSRKFPNRTSGLHLTARYGLLHLTERLLRGRHEDGNIGVDSEDSNGRTPLRWAAQNGHEAVVKLLLDTGKADADSKDLSNRTPLYWAAQDGHEAVVKLLLDTGKVDADSKDSKSRTPLSRAAQDGHEVVAKLLLDTGKVDVDSTDLNGRTPLSRAAQDGHEAVVKLLLDTGKADADLKDLRNRTPLWWAAQDGHEAVVKLLLDAGKVDVAPDGRTPLWWAALRGHETVVKLLLDTGKVDADSKDSNGQTPLLMAARNGHESVVKLLLDTGKVDADSKDSDGQTPLLLAARNGHEAVVKLLLDTGKVDADSMGSDGQTSLWWAALNGHVAVVQLLLDIRMVDVDLKDS